MKTKEKIIKAAVNEFSEKGFHGGRVENIARSAGVNKALIFYYYSSKEILYGIVLRTILKELFDELNKKGVIRPSVTPEEFIDKFPDIYINFFVKNTGFLKIIGLELIRDPENFREKLKDALDSSIKLTPVNLQGVISEWYQDGKITESDPVHFFMNIASLCIFPIIFRPVPEAIFGMNFDETEFVKKRIESVKNILRGGILR
ncbi:MAG: TetR family transcriptional regulator [Acidobacteriota bacterium]